MRNYTTRSWSAALAGVAGLSTALFGAANPLTAGGDVPAKGRQAAIPFNTTHQSVVQIRPGEVLPQTRAIVVGRNKSVLVELPRELRDVVVSNPELMDAVVQSSNRVYLIGKKNGQSNAFFFGQDGEQMLILEVMIEQDTSALDAMYRRLLPGSNIKTEILNDTLILTGSVRNPIDSNRAFDLASRFALPNGTDNDRQKTKVVNLLAVEAEDQVMVRVTIAEVQRTVLKQLGINLGAQFASGSIGFNVLSENGLPLTAAQGLGSLAGSALNTAAASAACAAGAMCQYGNSKLAGAGTGFGNSGIAGGWSNGNQRIQEVLRAMERDGLVRTLAEPNLTAVSGETAKFLAGGEYPFPAVDSLGALSVTFKEYGIGLSFTPVVLSEGRISLKVETEVSELDSANGVTIANSNIPGIKKRQAKSTVELPSGGSMALAGLISDQIRQNIDGFPGLKDLPVLGTLFRSRDFVRAETELVVIVTPYTVRPTSRQQLAKPDDGFAPATDLKANFLGHLNRIYGKGTVMPDGGLKGDYGFIVE